jgi:hypothetical protein
VSARWNFSTKPLPDEPREWPNAPTKRWEVYVDGELVGIKFMRFTACGPKMPKAMSTSDVEMIVNSPAGRRWAGVR